MTTKHFLLLITLLLVPSLTFAQGELPDPAFNPNYIISDYELQNANTMTQGQIQYFLESKNSALATLTFADPIGRNLSAAQAIYEISQASQINPKFLLVLLQKEQGLIEEIDPSPKQLDWATGYGCPDGGGCNDRWRGFWKQVNSASLQFKDYLDSPELYKYQVGQSYTFTNPYSTVIKATVEVVPVNKGTAALYNYTPHVYNGNYNFWKLWRRYFNVTQGHPNGTLLQVSGQPGVWLIQNGERRAFLAKGALISRFDINKVIPVSAADLLSFPVGNPIKFPQYSIVRSPSKQLYLLVDDSKRLFASEEAFRKFGYNPDEVLTATDNDLSSYVNGTQITANDLYPAGALLQNKKTGGVYWVEGQLKSPITDAIYLKTRFKGKKIIAASPETLDKYQTGAPIKFADGELIRLEKGSSIFVVENSVLRPFISMEVFNSFGYKAANIISVNTKTFTQYSVGLSLGTQ